MHTFNTAQSERSQSQEIYLGRLGIHEEIDILFKNDSKESSFVENVTIPIICLKSDVVQPELSLCGEGVELKILFVLDKVLPVAQKVDQIIPVPVKFVPSSRAYQTIRNGVIAIANTRVFIDNSLQGITGTVRYAVDSSRFVISLGYDLSSEFLSHVDVLFDEGCQLVDSNLDVARTALCESLLGLTRRLQEQLQAADNIISEKIRAILRRLRPLVNRLVRLVHPYVSLAMYLSGPARSLLVPYVQPFVDRALSVHEGLQQNFLVGGLVSTATSRAREVLDDTLDMYNELETESKAKDKVKKI